MSRAVSCLEAGVGVRVFDRNPREVSLTEEGRRFPTQVMPVLAGLEAAAADAAGAAEVVRGRLRVSVDPWFARTMLASKLQQLLTRYPLMSLDFSTSNYREEMMTGIDVAVRFGPPDASSHIARKLLETRVITVAAPAYLERHGVPRSPRDIVHHGSASLPRSAGWSAISSALALIASGFAPITVFMANAFPDRCDLLGCILPLPPCRGCRPRRGVIHAH